MHQKGSHYAAELECMKEDNWIQCCRLELSVEQKSIISRWCFAKCKKSNVLRCLSHLQNDYFSIFNQSINTVNVIAAFWSIFLAVVVS